MESQQSETWFIDGPIKYGKFKQSKWQDMKKPLKCEKCQQEKPILILMNGVFETLNLCVDCHKEFMKIAKDWLKND